MDPAPVIFLMGPTASGKTAVAVELVNHLPLEIVSVDSALVYRGLDVGTAKPGADVLARAPHRLVDIVEPTEIYSAARFRRDAEAAIHEIHGVGRVPLLVGGTGLYFRALEQGLSPLPAANPEIRERIARVRREAGNQALHDRLRAVDPVSAARIHPNDPQRVQRALEVFELTGRSMSEGLAGGRTPNFPFPVLKLVLMPPDRGRLRDRIARRLDDMIARGLVEEVTALRSRPGITRDLAAMRAVGYRQVWGYLEGDYGLAEMRKRLQTATAQLAKRQMTWFRAEPGAHFLDPFEPLLNACLLARVREFLEKNGVKFAR